MKRMTKKAILSTLLIPLLMLSMASCRGVGGLSKQPIDKIDGDLTNGERVLQEGFDTVLTAARQSLADLDLKIVRDEQLASGGRMLIGEESMSMWSNGGYVRVVILDADEPEGVTVRVLTLTKSAMNITANWNYAPKVFAALDRNLDRNSG